MISTCFSAMMQRDCIRAGITRPALSIVTSEKGRVRFATREEMADSTIKSSKKMMSLQDMKISSWEVFRIAIIGDLVMAIIAVIVCLGVGYGCDASPGVWAITAASLSVPTLVVDYICYRMSIKHIIDVIDKNMKGESQTTIDLALN